MSPECSFVMDPVPPPAAKERESYGWRRPHQSGAFRPRRALQTDRSASAGARVVFGLAAPPRSSRMHGASPPRSASEPATATPSRLNLWRKAEGRRSPSTNPAGRKRRGSYRTKVTKRALGHE